MNEAIGIIVPTLGRARSLRPLVENIRATTPRGTWSIYFVADPDDAATLDALADMGAPKVLDQGGSYPEKTNAGVAIAKEPWLLLTADDVVFHDGWLEAA